MSGLQASRRRPVTYGKKSQTKSFGFGLDVLTDDTSPSKPPARLHMPTTSPAKLRKANAIHSALEGNKVFEVESSEDELRLPDTTSESVSPKKTHSPAPARVHIPRSDAKRSPVQPARQNNRSASVASEKKRKRTTAPNEAHPKRSLRVTPDVRNETDSSFASTPHVLRNPTPEPSTTRPATPATEKRMAATTPKQLQLWKNLFSDSDSDTTPATKMQKLRLHSTTKPKLQTIAHTSPASQRLIDVLQRADDQSEMSFDASSVITADESIPEEQDVEMMDRPTISLSQQGPQIAGPRVTYAQQRSYLQDQANSLEDMLSQPLDEDAAFGNGLLGQTVAKPVKRSVATFDFPDDDDDDNNEGTSQMKNIHELRASGGLRRFQDETTDLIDDLDPRRSTPLSRRRQVYITLAIKLRDDDFRKRFLHSSYDGQLFERCTTDRDPISLAGIAAAAYFLLQAPSHAQVVAHALESQLIEVLIKALAFDKDLPVIARERQSNMSKSAQKSVAELKNVLYGAMPAFKDAQKTNISPQRISLAATECLVRRSREAKRMETLLSPKMVDVLLKIGDPTCLKPQISERGQLWRDAETVLSILESATVSQVCACDQGLWNSDRLGQVAEQLTAVIRPDAKGMETTRPLALKLCINLANNNERNSDEFARTPFVHALLSLIKETLDDLPKFVGAEDEGAARQEDTLLLSLGALANLTEVSGTVRQCIERDERTTFDGLVRVFAIGQEQTAAAASVAASRAAVAYGYLAILLANLALNPRLRARMAAKLPDGRVSMLVEAVEAFIVLHGETDQKEESSSSEWVAFTGRLQAVADSLKEVMVLPGAHGVSHGIGK